MAYGLRAIKKTTTIAIAIVGRAITTYIKDKELISKTKQRRLSLISLQGAIEIS